MRKLKHLCVFCGASTPSHAAHAQAILELGNTMLSRRIGLVYGGGRVGLMGIVAERVMAGGGTVLGVIPHQLQRRELANLDVTELKLVDTMHERKTIMYERSDGFVVMPGGFGTLDEAMEILTWKQLGIHDKPIVFVSIGGYFDGLAALFERSIQDGLLKPEYRQLFAIVPSIGALFEYLDSYEPKMEGISPWA
ncbi:MAG: TIGR00730 family Rossman fold protein [Candidatus Sericytochromatia bacterium]|nr:TIGR00730 family Rossman fold protein [Candidatus Sericytochromatia bacterium]